MKEIDTASRKFKFVSKSNNRKFKYLPHWVLSEASYFEKEVTNPERNHKIYQRGALVFIDFGINVGNELSGDHFGIVLNRNDSSRNGVLTVVPVSSKSNRFSVKIDGLISQKSLVFLNESIRNLEIERKILALHEIKDELTEEEQKEKTITYSLDGNSHIKHYKYMTTANFNNKIEQLSKEIDELQVVVNTYLKFDKISYAKTLDIRTISKKRIINLNQFDPVGKIKVSKETLDNIDKVILKNFTNL